MAKAERTQSNLQGIPEGQYFSGSYENEHFPNPLTVTSGKIPGKGITFTNCHFGNMNIGRLNNEVTFIDCDFDILSVTMRADENAMSPLKVQITQPENQYEIKSLIMNGVSNARFRNMIIHEAQFQQMANKCEGYAFESCQLHEIRSSHNNTVEALYFKNCIFINIAGFGYMNFGQDIEFSNSYFGSIDDTTESTFRHLKTCFAKNNNEHLANLFKGYELKSKFNSYMEESTPKRYLEVEYYFNKAYEFINNFGLDPYRPLKYLFYFSLCSSSLILLVSYILLTVIAKDALNFDLIKSFGHNFIVLFFGPFRLLVEGYKLELLPILNFGFFRLLLTLVSSLLWFFLILGIRKRFKIDG